MMCICFPSLSCSFPFDMISLKQFFLLTFSSLICVAISQHTSLSHVMYCVYVQKTNRKCVRHTIAMNVKKRASWLVKKGIKKERRDLMLVQDGWTTRGLNQKQTLVMPKNKSKSDTHKKTLRKWRKVGNLSLTCVCVFLTVCRRVTVDFCFREATVSNSL